MNFQFESLEAFMAMGGHGGFVWACYAMGLVTLTALVLAPVWGRKKFIRQQRQWAARKQAQTDSGVA